MAIRGASLVAAADGEIQTPEKKLIYKLGECLNLPHPQVEKILKNPTTEV